MRGTSFIANLSHRGLFYLVFFSLDISKWENMLRQKEFVVLYPLNNVIHKEKSTSINSKQAEVTQFRL